MNNINLVSPSHYANQIIEALKIYRPNIPIVWNSNGYDDINTIEKMSEYVDIFLVDLKFFDTELSTKYCKAKDYFEIATMAIKKMIELKPNVVIENDIMKSGVIIRHLVMPNCTDDSIKILEWIAKNAKDNSIVSLMGQYTPCFKASEYPEINRKLKPLEYKVVLNKMLSLGLTNGFVQELESSDEKYIPLWDLKGV